MSQLQMGRVSFTRFVEKRVEPNLARREIFLLLIDKQQLDGALRVVTQPRSPYTFGHDQPSPSGKGEALDLKVTHHDNQAFPFRDMLPGQDDCVLEISYELVNQLRAHFGAGHWNALQLVHMQGQGYRLQPVRSIQYLPQGAQGK